MRRIIIYILGLAMSAMPVTARASQQQTLYAQQLQAFLKQSKAYIELPVQLPPDTKKFEAAVYNFQSFSQQYPDSIYNDDIQFMIICICFVDAVLAQEWGQADKYKHDMDSFLNTTPDLSLEETTIVFGKRVFGKQAASAFLAIPSSNIISFMNGWQAWAQKDYPAVIEYLLPVKDAIHYERDETGTTARMIYEGLTTAYIKQSDPSQAQSLARQALQRFPDNRMLREAMRKVLSRDVQQ